MRMTVKTWICIASIVTVAGHAHASTPDFNQPTIDFGTVTSWAVKIARGQAIYQLTSPFSQQLLFSLDNTSDIRIDVRSMGTQQKYNTTQISSAQFDIFDAAHSLVGHATVDPTFQKTTCPAIDFVFGASCNTEFGMTFSSTLNAGNYSVEFRPTNMGYNFSPDVRFGVAVNNPELMPAYLAQLTPTVPEPSTGSAFLLGLAALPFVLKRVKR